MAVDNDVIRASFESHEKVIEKSPEKVKPPKLDLITYFLCLLHQFLSFYLMMCIIYKWFKSIQSTVLFYSYFGWWGDILIDNIHFN